MALCGSYAAHSPNRSVFQKPALCQGATLVVPQMQEKEHGL
jgi:hypothetical protein